MNNLLLIFLGGDERYGHILMMVQPREPKQNCDSIFEIEFPEFDGGLNHEEFVDRLNQVEERFLSN